MSTALKTALADSDEWPEGTSIHGHSNKSALDKVGEDEGDPTWNGGAWPGGAGHDRQHSMTSGSDHQMATARMIGRTTAEAGAPEELTAANVRNFIGVEEGAVSDTVKYGTTITDNADITYANHAGKTTMVNKATDVTLILKKADWVAGKWSVFRQYGAGQFTITAEDGNVKLPTNVKSYGIGSALRVECYLVDGSDKYFSIDGGSE